MKLWVTTLVLRVLAPNLALAPTPTPTPAPATAGAFYREATAASDQEHYLRAARLYAAAARAASDVEQRAWAVAGALDAALAAYERGQPAAVHEVAALVAPPFTLAGREAELDRWRVVLALTRAVTP